MFEIIETGTPGAIQMAADTSWAEFWLNVAATFGAAGAGAYAAFFFDRIQRRGEREAANVAAGNVALSMLAEIWNVQLQYRTEVVDEWRNREDVWLNLPANSVGTYDGISIDIASIAFMFDTQAQVVQRAALEKRRFDMLLHWIREHSDVVMREVFPALTAAGVQLNQNLPEAHVRQILGVGPVQKLTVLSSAIIQNATENVASSRQCFDDFRVALKAIYPKRRFINVMPAPQAAPPGPPPSSQPE
jgi:hypothetical protein